MLPFTSEQFLSVFEAYNAAIWPAQVFAYFASFLAVVLLFTDHERSDWIIPVILAIMWMWTGLAYHMVFFAPINSAAYAFGALFIVQAGALVHAGFRHRLAFGFRVDAAGWIGIAFVAYAAVLYPLIGMAAGHRASELPMLGVTPCPVTIFTFGLLLLTRSPPPLYLLAIPAIWSLIGGSAAMLLRVPQDWLLLVSGVTAVGLVATGDWKRFAS
jgi:Family of unknown function (DUF6064)